MRAEVICLLAARAATAADLLHPNLIDVAYSGSLDRCSNQWYNVDDYFDEPPANEDKAEDDDRGFYRTKTEYKLNTNKKKKECFCAEDDQNPAYWQF